VLLHGVAFALAFLVISYAHVIIGEVVPKNLAIENADRVAVLAAPALAHLLPPVAAAHYRH
jgi:CBS domain containing-hemolysin-like protein